MWRFLILLLAAVHGCSRLAPGLAGAETCHSTERPDSSLLAEDVDFVTAAAPNDQPLLDLWCETVGPAIYYAQPAPTPDSVRLDSLAIVSWNTAVGGGDLVRFVRDLRAGRFTNGDSVTHFALLLQEVFRASNELPGSLRIGVPGRIAPTHAGRARRDIVEAATALGLSVLYVPSMRNGPPREGLTHEDRGNAVLSSLPLHDPEAIDLPYEVQRRVVATAEVKGKTSGGKEWTLRLASVHLDTRSRFAQLPASVGAGRRRQAEGLVPKFEDDEPLVLAGDLNTWAAGPLERVVPYLRQTFPDSPPPVGMPTFSKGGYRRRLDYMFFRLPEGGAARYERVDRQYGSDHYPLLGWVRLNGT